MNCFKKMLFVVILFGICLLSCKNIQAFDILPYDLENYHNIEYYNINQSNLGKAIRVNDEPQDYCGQKIVCYSFEKKVSMPLAADNIFRMYAKNSTLQYSSNYSITKGKSVTELVSKSISEGTKNNISGEIEIDFKLPFKLGPETKIKGGCSKEWSYENEITVGSEYNYQISSSFSCSETDTFYVNESGIYRKELRANFNVYLFVMFDFCTMNGHYVYKPVYSNYFYNIINNTYTTGIFKYYEQNGLFYTDNEYLNKEFNTDIYYI